MIYTEQMWDKMCRKLVSQKNMVIKAVLSQLLCLQVVSYKKNQYVHGLQHDIITGPHSFVPTILHEVYNSEDH